MSVRLSRQSKIAIRLPGNQIAPTARLSILQGENPLNPLFTILHMNKIKQDRRQFNSFVWIVMSGTAGEKTNEVKGKRKETIQEGERARRLKKQGRDPRTKKNIIAQEVEKAFIALSEEQFLGILKNNGLKFYRRGKTVGVVNIETKKKYRLNTLGVLGGFESMQKRWSRGVERKKEIDEVRQVKAQRVWREMGFVEDMLEQIEEPFEIPQDVMERKVQLRNFLKSSRKKQRGGRYRREI